MSGQVVAIGDHETTPVIHDRAADPAVILAHADLDATCGRVLLDVGQRFRHLAENDGLDLDGLIVEHLELELGLHAGDAAHDRDAVPDRLLESARDLERGRPHVEQHFAKRLLGLV